MPQNNFQTSSSFANEMDAQDTLKHFREQFFIPKQANGEDVLYFTGNSLGLQPKTARRWVESVLIDWETLAVEGHFNGANPWMTYHEEVSAKMAAVVGANPFETVAMNFLTVNLHLLLVSFYRPTATRYKIVMEKGAFPSDQYAIKSQIEFHQVLSPAFRRQTAENQPAQVANEEPPEGGTQNWLIELSPRDGEATLRTEDIIETLEKNADSIALVMLGGVNYYSGQFFDIEQITAAGHKIGAVVGWDLAHAAGNVELKLHDWNVDFACWCTYKYLNSGPGGIGGAFVHERHSESFDLPRFAGWWGHDKATRFLMDDRFVPMRGAEGWQLSNQPIFLLASLRASLDIFEEVGMKNLREKSVKLTNYLEFLLNEIHDDRISIITPNNPNERGCQLSIRVGSSGKKLFDELSKRGIIADWREPDVIRVAPVPLYNSFLNVYEFAAILRECLK
jgi:kynureninase